MKDTIREKLIILATAQDRLANVAGRLDIMEKSVTTMEKCSYELINKSDKLVRLSNSGLVLANRLKEAFMRSNIDAVMDKESLLRIIDEIHENILNIYNTSMETNISVHEIETEAVCQRDNKDFINDSLSLLSDSINSAAACAELLLAQY